MTREELIAICQRWDACDPALDWLGSLTCETASECWDACERGDWLVWLLTARTGIVPDRALRLIAVDCARAVQPIADKWFAVHAPQHVGAGVRLLDLIESDRDADLKTWDTAMAASAASDAASAASGAARDAAWASRDAAWDAARDAAWAAVRDAAWAAVRDASKDATWVAASAAARDDQARIVRSRVSWAEVEAGLRGVA